MFTLGSIYSANASGAEQMPETNIPSDQRQTKANQLAIYKRDRVRAWPRDYREQTHLAVRAGLELGASGLKVKSNNRSATLPPLTVRANRFYKSTDT